MVNVLRAGPTAGKLRAMEAASVAAPDGLRRTRGRGDRIGDTVLYGITACAAVIGVAVVFAIVWRIAEGAWPAIKVFDASFLWHNEWNPVTNKFGARDLIIGTLVTSFGAVAHRGAALDRDRPLPERARAAVRSAGRSGR